MQTAQSLLVITNYPLITKKALGGSSRRKGKETLYNVIQQHHLYSKIYIYETFQNILLPPMAAYTSK